MFTLQLHHEHGTGSVAERLGGRRVQEWCDENGQPRAYGYAAPGWWAMEWPGRVTFRFRAGSPAVEVFHRPDMSHDRIDDTYRRSVIPLQLQALGYETLHGSAISIEGRTVAFCGDRRTGKSTLAYALRQRGFPHRADDTVVLSIDRGLVRSLPLPFSPRLRPSSARFFGTASLEPVTIAEGAEELGAVFVLQQNASLRGPLIEPVSGGQAVAMLLAHAHCFDPLDHDARRRMLENYLEVASRVPLYRLSFPPGLSELPSIVDGVLATAGAVACTSS
jgi:hypothetical protein